ncbi:MAG: hypothetical protein LQ343_007409 [Gyalolechia ehrenbergii]|nr:MAG: hypothetical protein LQ343_007409 [Gyalolechia ehrenbergii]
MDRIAPQGAATSSLAPTNFEVREFTYEVPGTNTALDFIVFLDSPVEHQALGAAILSPIQWINKRIRDRGDGWLDHEDDPFESTVSGRCFIQIVSKKTNTGRSRMTYRTLLSVFEGMWNVLYASRQDLESCLRIRVAGLLAGFGTIRVEEPTG